MEHKGTVTLETERLILRRFEERDAENAFRNWMSSDTVTKFLRWETHSDISVTRGYMNYLRENYKKPNFYDWAIELKTLGEPIGSIGIVVLNENVQSAEVGYCIGEKWWRHGYTSEALAAVIKFFFEEVGVNRVYSEHDPQNPNSGKVMQKCGLKYEGTLRQADRNNTGICDTCVYGILKEEYERSAE
ncbi:MAG: GNAT family N-acetyltransferase [Lachnospiraceae bacterium]|nr:GNAT family N-acetyltransferase [Ruminococcus sp.]MCM1274883.1 GNAT family N-acetyltransferase [Lachnospiraceae bacterium]